MGIPYRPKENSLGWKISKDLKQGFDDPRLDLYELTLVREVFLSHDPGLVSWRVEILHRIALRRESRGDIDGAHVLYKKALRALGSDDFMTRARLTRDYALFFSNHIDVYEGLELAKQALALHEHDVDNEKGRRQRRITESYVWRAQILANENTKPAVDALTQFALDGCLDCYNRDQQVVVQFALRYTKGMIRGLLLERQLDIHSQRGKPLKTIISIAHIGINTSLTITGRIVRLIVFRKE